MGPLGIDIDFVFKIAIGCVAPLIWLVLFLLEDRKKPEPKGMLAEVFVSGVVVALLFASGLYFGLRELFPEFLRYQSAITIFMHAFGEEIFKFSAVYLIVSRNKFFDEPIDAMIYMITGAMGFAAMENIFLAFTTPDPLNLMVFRFFGAVLLHAHSGGIIGFYWAKNQLWKGLLIATMVHGTFNFLMVYFENGILLATWLIIIVSFFILRNFDIIKHNQWTTNTKFKK